MVQATVAAHISAVCTTALRHREDIIATTIPLTSTPDAEGLTPTPSFTESMSSADTAVEGDDAGNAGSEALEPGGIVGGPHAGSCGGGDSSADSCDRNGVGGGDVDPAGRGHLMKAGNGTWNRSPDTKRGEENQLEEREEKIPQLTEDGRGEEAAAIDAASVGSTDASPLPNTPVETDAADRTAAAEDDDDDDDWWEEDEEDREGKEGCEKSSGRTETAGSATHGAWWGTAGKAEKPQEGRGGVVAWRLVGSGTSRWMRRREREAPFLRLLVRSQVC